jgi:hypothetical protein
MHPVGWLKIHRKMRNWEWYHDANCVRVWLHLLLTVNYEKSRFEGREVMPGSRVTGYPALAKECGLSVQQVRTVFSKLKSTGEITVTTHSKFSIVSIAKWDEFQEDNRQDNSHSTGFQQASNRLPTTSKEYKKGIREEYILDDAKAPPESGELPLDDSPKPNKQTGTKYTPDFEAFWKAYPKRTGNNPKLPAFKKWKGLTRGGVPVDTIIQGAKAYAAARNGQDAQYTQQAVTWLNQAGWEQFQSKQDNPPEEQITLKNGKQMSRLLAVRRCTAYFERKAGGEMNGRLWERLGPIGDEYPPDHRETVYPDEIVREAKSIAACH